MNQKTSLLVATCAVLAGCATPPQNTATIDIQNPGQGKVFRVAKTTPTGKSVSDFLIISSLTTSLKSNLFKDASVVYNSQNGSIDAAWKWALSLNHNFLTASYPISINDVGGEYIVKLNCPTTMKSEIRDLSLTGIPKWNSEKIGINLSDACRSSEVNIGFFDEFKGEVDTSYNDSSVFSNYRRKLKSASADAWGQYKSQSKATALDIEKSEKFLVPVGAGNSIASVVVVPYRNGSKVMYAFGYNYSVKGDGATTYKQSDVDSIKALLKSIAND